MGRPIATITTAWLDLLANTYLKTQISVEGVTSSAQGEELTVALLDSIAIHWLLSIDRRLISIVKTEFSTELKTKRLSEMIKPIATNIDDLW